MTKPPEEGQVWEWRAFGKISHTIVALVEALPIRNRIRDLPASDIYFIPPLSEQNVKLRLTDRGWVLKFKRLLEKQPSGIELYHETARWTFPFPISLATVQEAARLLEVTIPAAALQHDHFTQEQTIAALTAASPAIRQVEVNKIRSQYEFERGWIEIADAGYNHHRMQSLSIHSPNLETVEQMLAQLRPGSELKVMNYVEACRRLS